MYLRYSNYYFILLNINMKYFYEKDFIYGICCAIACCEQLQKRKQ